MAIATIRPATRGDVPAVHGLIRELAAYEKLEHLCTGTEHALDEALFGAFPGAEVLVAEVGGEIVGFALFFPTFSTFLARRGLWLEDLYVKPAHRGLGLGARLLRAVAAVAVERRCGRFEWAVLDWNVSAIAFYERMGATVMTDWQLCRITGEPLARLGSGGAD
ncbi:MAG: GNAT family N-acetyltransferase [Vicinamibacteria bacterium]